MTERDFSLELWRLMEALADSTDGATKEELAEALGSEAKDLDQLAEDNRALLLSSVSKFRKRNLAEAREAYETSAADYRSKLGRALSSTGRMRELLGSVLAAKPELRPALTAQFRDFNSMSGSDVESALRQLVALGVIDDEDLGDPSDGE